MSPTSDQSFLASDGEGLDLKKWGLAAAIVLLAHAGLIYWATHASPQSLSVGQLEPAIMIDLGAGGGEGGEGQEGGGGSGSKMDEIAPQQQDEAALTENKSDPKPEPVAPAPPLPDVAPMPETPIVPKAAVVMPVQKPVKKEVPKKQIVKKDHEQKAKALARTETKPEKGSGTGTSTGRGSGSGSGSVSGSGAGGGGGGGGGGAAANDWKSRVFAQLARNKRYPDSERQNGIQGVVNIAFTIDRSGNVLSAHVTRGSGSSALDSAAMEMVHRASPLPPPPSEIGGGRITLAAPVRFSVR